jgi:hypothetical protein
MVSNGNCKPSTIVDSAITSSYLQDFHLQSHKGLKGTGQISTLLPLVNKVRMTDASLQSFVSTFPLHLEFKTN